MLLQDFIDLGLTFENCESWFERGAFPFMVILVVITAKFALIVSCPKRYCRTMGSCK
jgi:hypothetical protein